MKAATTNATVVKKPNEFWTRVRELYMAGKLSNAIEAFPSYYKKRKKEGEWCLKTDGGLSRLGVEGPSKYLHLLATFLEPVPEALEVWRLSLVVDWVIVGL